MAEAVLTRRAKIDKPNLFRATGGTEFTIGSYKVHVFNSNGNFTVLEGNRSIEYLIIAGGGGGGFYTGAGGGAGGYRCSVSGESSGGGSSAESPMYIGPGTYPVVVGAGGAGSASTAGSNGQNSSFNGIISIGGGGGGGYGAGQPGKDGGSGGGGAGFTAALTLPGLGTANQGYSGGYGVTGNQSPGGGGGAGAAATRTGGVGVSSSITGIAITRAGGGGAGGQYGFTSSTAGGLGGGGAGGQTDAGTPGTANTGGGGGGGANMEGVGKPGAAGGSGVVILRYLIENNNKSSYELLADITISSTTSSIDITGLNIGKDEEIVLVCNFNNTAATGSDYLIFANSNYTWTNYYRQYLIVGGTAINASRLNNPAFSLANEYRKSLAIVKLKLTNSGYFVFQSNTNQRYDELSNYQLYNVYGTSTFTISSITSLRILGTISNSIGIGSRFQLYKAGV